MKYVDLGLPSNTLWSDCYCGAKFPHEYGNCYQDVTGHGNLPTIEQVEELFRFCELQKNYT